MGTFLKSIVPFQLYLGFHWSECPENLCLALSVHALATVQVHDRSIINGTLFKYHYAFSAVSPLLIVGIFLKIHTSLSVRMRYKRCKFGCSLSVISDP
jgi:hypothetical protein